MAQRESGRPARRGRVLLGWVPDLLVVALLVAAAAAYQFRLGERWGLEEPDPRQEPALVLPPEGLDLPTPAPVPDVARASRGGRAAAALVRRALESRLGDKDLGRHVDLLVTDLTSGRELFRSGTGPVTPASTTKLLTSVAALSSMGAGHRFTTSVVRRGNRVTLVGGGDPFLAGRRVTDPDVYPARASLQALAAATAKALPKGGAVRLAYDDTLFSGAAFNPAWPAGYRPDVVPSITALWDDEGRSPDGDYLADPSRDAAQDFASLLRARGVRVRGSVTLRAAHPQAKPVAQVRSAPLGQVVERLLDVSDNNAAEVVGHHVGIAERQGGSFEGGARAVLGVLSRLGIDTSGDVLYDGSGLSRLNRVDPATLAAVVRTAAASDHPELRQAVTGMPVAGFTGSLQWRFDKGAPAGRGRVQTKTGTLTGVHGLAGVVTDVEANAYAFVMIADRVRRPKQLEARIAIDEAAAALADCRCTGTRRGRG